jgi:uncharacterized RDD family membrane protein YckC
MWNFIRKTKTKPDINLTQPSSAVDSKNGIFDANPVSPDIATGGAPWNQPNYAASVIGTAPLDAADVPKYAGVWRRVLASLIDDALVGPLIWSVVAQLILSYFIFMNVIPRVISYHQFVSLSPCFKFACGFLIICTLLFGEWLYQAGFESSLAMATPGKRFLKMRVMDRLRKRMIFWRVIFKSVVPPALFIVGIICAFAIPQILLNAIPDALSVLKTPVLMAGVFTGVVLFFAALFGNVFFVNSRNQTISDVIVGRTVELVPASSGAPGGGVIPKLFPGEKRVLIAIFSLWIVFALEIVFFWLCGGELDIPDSNFKVNTTGNKMIATHDMEANTILKPEDWRAEQSNILCTSPFAVSYDYKMHRPILLSDVRKGQTLTYANTAPVSFGISKIISIQAAPDKNERLSWHMKADDEDFLGTWNSKLRNFASKRLGMPIPSDNASSTRRGVPTAGPGQKDSSGNQIERNFTGAAAANKNKQFADARALCDKGIQSLFLDPTSTPVVNLTAPLKSSVLASQSLKDRQLGWKAIFFDLLQQRAVANIGLGDKDEAKNDCQLSLNVLATMHEDWLHNNESDFLAMNDTDKYGEQSNDKPADEAKKEAMPYLKELAETNQAVYERFVQKVERLRSSIH